MTLVSKKTTILIISVVSKDRKILKKLFTKENYSTIVRKNGKLAFKDCLRILPTLIVLDLEIQGMDSYEICKLLKSHPSTKVIPIVLISSSQETTNELKAFELGAIDFFQKPYREEIFLARVKSHIQHYNNLRDDELQEKEERLRALSESQLEAIVMHEQGTILDVNFAATKVFGYSKTEMIGNNIWKLLTTGSHTTVRDKIIERFEESYEVEGLRKNGETFPMEIHSKEMSYMDRIVRVAAIRDISERKEAEQKVIEQQKELERSYKESEKLLFNILPEEVALGLKENGFYEPVQFDSASVMFTDITGFTKIAIDMHPKQLVILLDLYFSGFDDIIDDYNLEKLKTIGDSYMCAGGIPIANKTHPIDCVLSAMEFMEHVEYINDYRRESKLPYWDMRIGIHTGPLVAGIIGTKKFTYDLWGDTVNTASRMETASNSKKINISGTTYNLVKDYFDCEYRGKIDVKNKGGVDMYFVIGIKAELSVDGKRLKPNKEFKELYKKRQEGLD